MNNLLEAGRCIFRAALIWFLATLIRVIFFLVVFVVTVWALVMTYRLYEIAVGQ